GAKNEAAARLWYLRAAILGHADAEKEFAARVGFGIASPEGEKLWDEANRIRAKASTDAEFAVAKKQAFPLYLQAAELGHTMSIDRMVDSYQYGDGVEKSMERAREWAQIAAELGNPSNQTILAQYMLHGTGGPRNTQGARFWFEQAALTGNSVARMFLAKIYDGEFGFPPNEALATYWWIEAYKVGNMTAELELKRRGLLEPDPQSQAVIERMHRDGPDRSSVEKFTYDVAVYCKFGGPRCHEFSIAARRFQQEHNASADAANMARLWNVYSNKDPDADRKWRERSDCMKKKTDALQRHTYGQQDWYYTGACH
ncbi:MAG TPA: tetratricopeptide repeat protein, partial [Thermoanaerobaculia bacterium]